MKKIIIAAAAVLLIAGTTMAQDKPKAKSCTKACCKQPSKTASLRTKATKPAAQPVKPATKK